MRLSLSIVLVAFVALSACDSAAPSEPASASSDEIIAAHASAASSTTCPAPSIAFGPLSGGANTVIATASSGNVSVVIEEKTNIYNNTWEPVFGASFSNGNVTYVTDWAPAIRTPYYAVYRAEALCSNGATSSYSGTISSGVEP